MIGTIKEIVCYLKYQIPRVVNRSPLNKTGYVVRPKDAFKLDTNEIQRVISGIDSVLQSSSGVKVWSDEICADQRIHGFENVFAFNKEFLDHVVLIAEQYHKTPFSHFSILAAKLTFHEGNLGSGGGWHRDSAYRSQVKVIVYLTDVRNENGPFEYLPKTHSSLHKLKSYGLGSAKLRFTKEDVQGMEIKPDVLTGPAGTSIVVDTKGIHRGRPIESGCRYALTFYFFDNGDISPNIRQLINGPLSSCRT